MDRQRALRFAASLVALLLLTFAVAGVVGTALFFVGLPSDAASAAAVAAGVAVAMAAADAFTPVGRGAHTTALRRASRSKLAVDLALAAAVAGSGAAAAAVAGLPLVGIFVGALAGYLAFMARNPDAYFPDRFER